jgi:hypothetical protein
MTRLAKSLVFVLPFYFLLALSAGSRSALSKQSDASPISAMVLEQSSDIYGKTKTFLSTAGLRIELLNSNVVVVAKAPTWKVVFYNTVTKNGLAMSKDNWLSHEQNTTYIASDWDRRTIAIKRLSTTAKFGHPARTYKVIGKNKPSGLTASDHLRDCDYVEIDKADVRPEAIAIMQKCLSTPSSSGIPIEFINHRPVLKTEAFKTKGSGDETFLHTSKVQDSMVPAKFFEYPKTLTLKRVEADVMTDPQKQQQIQESFNTFLR